MVSLKTFLDKTSNLQVGAALPGKVSQKVSQWETITSRRSLELWSNFLLTKTFVKVWWQRQMKDFVALQFNLGRYCAPPTDSRSQSGSVELKLMSSVI